MALADRFDGLLIDLDGVVWVGREPVPGSAAALRELLAAGKQLVFVTNNPGRPPAAYAERLAGLGVEVGAERVVTAGMVAARLAAEAIAAAAGGGAPAGGGAAAGAGPRQGAFVIGAPALKEMVAAEVAASFTRHAGIVRGADAPSHPAALVAAEDAASAAAVVVSGHRDFDYAELLAAKRALDAGAALIATSRDPTMPMPGGEWPGTGAVLAAVETATGRRAEVAGKPERHLFELALARLSPELRCSLGPLGGPKEQRSDGSGAPRVAMVGDRPSSDVAGGRAAGLATVLVLSGTTDEAEAATAEPRADHVVADLAALLR